MASVISASTTSATALNMSADTTGVLQLATGATPTTAVTIDASQNVGIGTTSPSQKLTISDGGDTGDLRLKLGNSRELLLIRNANFDNWIRSVSTGADFYIDQNANANLIMRTNATERMRIDSSGRVTMSAQPRFLANRSSDQTGYNATSQGDVVVIYNATTQNVGSHFSTSTGKFTAPVAGMYVFQASAWSSGGTAFTQAWLVINGARADYSDQLDSNTGNAIYSATFLIYLNANDSVGYHAYNATNTNQTITTSGNHTWFKGYLIS